MAAPLPAEGIPRVKNVVIKERENICLDVVTFEDEDAEEMDEVTAAEIPYDCQDLWMVVQDDTTPLEERGDAVRQLQAMDERSDAHAQYLMGGLFHNGSVLVPDSVEVRHWFGQSAWKGHTEAQYALGKLYLAGKKVKRVAETAHYWCVRSASGSGRRKSPWATSLMIIRSNPRVGR